MKKLLLTLSLFLLSIPSFAEDHYVRMLNSGEGGMMVFEPAVLSVNVGDTVNFVATDMAHNSKSVLTPAGAKPWMGKMSQDISVTFDTEGVYVYECTPHVMMAMVGVIKVGDVKVDDATNKFANQYKSKFVMNHDRLKKYLLEL